MTTPQFKSVLISAEVYGDSAVLHITVVFADGTKMTFEGEGAATFMLSFAVTYCAKQLDDATAEASLRQAASYTGIRLPSWITLPPETP